MDAVQVMKDEHKYIKRVLKVFRKACLDILDGKEINYELFYNAIDFVRNYADKYHHGKEEDVLFKKMREELTTPAQISAVKGMFTEHDLGRLFMFNLDNALEQCRAGNREARLDVIANAIAYTDLLTRHIHKEDNALYNYGAQNLKPETIHEINKISEEIENKPENIEKRKKYITMVEQMEKMVGLH